MHNILISISLKSASACLYEAKIRKDIVQLLGVIQLQSTPTSPIQETLILYKYVNTQVFLRTDCLMGYLDLCSVSAVNISAPPGFTPKISRNSRITKVRHDLWHANRPEPLSLPQLAKQVI